jgi:hypothetical protein
MIKVSRQQRRKMHRDMGNNKWYVKDWQTMKFLRSEYDATGTGTIDIYANNLYKCIMRNNQPGITWLSIKRIDFAAIHNWQHLQQIKNDICGEDREAIELYPAMSRIVDCENQYHLWVFPDRHIIDLGFKNKLVKI